MPTYTKADETVTDLAQQLIAEVETHKWISSLELKIDYVFAYGTRDEDGKLTGDAIKHYGIKALGLCRVVPLKDRAMGRGDVEITVDHDWWEDAGAFERRAVLDHELTHIKPPKDTDDLGRPKIKLRKHDHQFGWFSEVAQRNGVYSIEQQQARTLMEVSGQSYWPSITNDDGTVTMKAGSLSVTIPHSRFSKIASEAGKQLRA